MYPSLFFPIWDGKDGYALAWVIDWFEFSCVCASSTSNFFEEAFFFRLIFPVTGKKTNDEGSFFLCAIIEP